MGKYNFTADLAWANALDHVYGWANSPHHWNSLDEREEAFWEKLRDLLGHPSEDELREALWAHRESIGRMSLRVVAHSMRGFAITTVGDEDSSLISQHPQVELPAQMELTL